MYSTAYTVTTEPDDSLISRENRDSVARSGIPRGGRQCKVCPMIHRADRAHLQFRAGLTLALLAVGSSACSNNDAQKSWNALGTCLAGSAASGPLAARATQLRLIQLANTGAATDSAGWPKRCAGYADDLYAALGSASETALLKTKLHERLACGDSKGTCTPPTDSSLISVATELWEAAANVGLKTEVASGISLPSAAAPPVITAPSWKSFSDKPMRMVGPLLTPDGRAIVLLKANEGHTRPRGCEFLAGLSKVSCFEGHADVPEFPAQTVDLVSDARSVYAAGLTEKGLSAFDLKTGKQSDVRGLGALRFVHDGLAVEHGEKNEGYQAVTISDGKAGKPTPLVIENPIGDPLVLGDQVVFLQTAQGGAQFVAKSLVGAKLKDVTLQKGTFSGTLHSCRRDSALGVAAFGARAGEHGAKATGGDGKTQVTVTLFQGGAWTKPSEATIPFERGIESDLVCSKTGVSLAYAQVLDGSVQVGRLDCDAAGCKNNEVKLPGVESKWWWAVGPLGDKTLVLWRSSLGETRLRIAPLSALANAKDKVVFDAPDFGGPSAAELTPLYSDDAALLLFRDEKPVALQVAAEGSVRVLTP